MHISKLLKKHVLGTQVPFSKIFECTYHGWILLPMESRAANLPINDKAKMIALAQKIGQAQVQKRPVGEKASVTVSDKGIKVVNLRAAKGQKGQEALFAAEARALICAIMINSTTAVMMAVTVGANGTRGIGCDVIRLSPSLRVREKYVTAVNKMVTRALAATKTNKHPTFKRASTSFKQKKRRSSTSQAIPMLPSSSTTTQKQYKTSNTPTTSSVSASKPSNAHSNDGGDGGNGYLEIGPERVNTNPFLQYSNVYDSENEDEEEISESMEIETSNGYLEVHPTHCDFEEPSQTIA